MKVAGTGILKVVGVPGVITAASVLVLLAGCRSSPVSARSTGSGMVSVEYAIHVSSRVTLMLYNSYNVKLETLVDTTETSGAYSVSWNSDPYPAGIYFYRFVAVPLAGGTTLDVTKKLIIE